MRRASSRLTASRTASAPSALRFSVSVLRSASNLLPSTSTAVRQTPLTSTESPGLSSPASGASPSRRAPPSWREIPLTVPSACTSPVNVGLPLFQPRLKQQVVTDRVAGKREGSLRGLDRFRALTLERNACRTPTNRYRRDEEPQLVDLAGVEERPRQVGTAFEQDALDPQLSQLVEPVLCPLVLASSDRCHDLGAGGPQGIRRCTGSHPRDDDDQRHLVASSNEIALEWEPRLRVERDTSWLTSDGFSASSEQGV